MVAKIYLDTNVFVDAFERWDAENSFVWPVLNAIEGGEFAAVTSEITLAELLPKLIADGETEVIAVYERLFDERDAFDTARVSRQVLVRAAQLRATRLSLRLPDAVHMATAELEGCSAIFSNDLRLASIGHVPLVPIHQDCLAKIRNIGP